MEIDGKQNYQNNPKPESRHGNAYHCRYDRTPIVYRSLFYGRQNTQRNRHNDRNKHGAERQLDRSGQSFKNDLHHRSSMEKTSTEIAPGSIVEKAKKPFLYRQIQAHIFTKGLLHFRSYVLITQHNLHRVSRGQTDH